MQENHLKNQHRVAKVYLKQFSFQENNTNVISVLKIGENQMKSVSIDDFTVETNLFDYPYSEFEIKKHFEITSGKLENKYPSLIRTINSQKRIGEKLQNYLEHLVANFLCRSARQRDFIFELLGRSELREKLINEITMFTNDKQELELTLSTIDEKHHLNILNGWLMNHYLHVFKFFKKYILKVPEGRKWFTTDNPVVKKYNGDASHIIPATLEIFFPLSTDFCLYMSYKREDGQFDISNRIENKINTVSYAEVDNICGLIFFNCHGYVLSPYNLSGEIISQKLESK